jgi:hypothetical protein
VASTFCTTIVKLLLLHERVHKSVKQAHARGGSPLLQPRGATHHESVGVRDKRHTEHEQARHCAAHRGFADSRLIATKPPRAVMAPMASLAGERRR